MNDSTGSGSGRFAPPQAEVADIAGDGLELAGRGTRLAAALIDGLLIAALLWGISRVTPWNVFAPNAASGMARIMVTNLVIGFIAFSLINGYLLATQGQTLGKRLLGLRIVRPDGERASLARLLGARYGVGYVVSLVPVAGGIYGLIDSLLIFRESRLCLHDNIANTIVVRA